MTQKIKCVLLIDDDEPTNFLHKIVLEDNDNIKHITVAETAREALHMLEHPKVDDCKTPDIIFLDLNMPGMNGWDFIEKYKVTKTGEMNGPKIFILTTSINPDDRKKAGTIKEVSGFRNKPLTDEIVQDILQQYF